MSTQSYLRRVWQPSATEPWNLQRVWHLHRRTGFGANWTELQRDLQEGHEAAIERIATQMTNSLKDEDFEQMSTTISDAAVASGNINRLKAWWLYRMLKSPSPLVERLTLMWHNHFATSYAKVRDVSLMRQQNELLRSHASGSFTALLKQMSHDPALLLWLDADANRREHPNENLAREIMELFSLGVGNYTERDIKEAARALTGWTVKDADFVNLAARHDSGEKEIFGRIGTWNGDDLIQLLIHHPATPNRIAWRLCDHFLGKANQAVVAELADFLHQHDLNIKSAIDFILRSEAFFREPNLGRRVCSPVETIVAAVRSLEMTAPLPSTLLLAESASNLGQDLFNPPNVFGWPGGRAWLTSRNMIGRVNLAGDLVAGNLHAAGYRFDAARLAHSHGFDAQEECVQFFTMLLLGREEVPSDLRHSTNDLTRFVSSLLASPYAVAG
ncbi:MAG: DUF1800 domain-containing protein [Planctomycetales bacterium]|nr:DUF1800 domain-containing protein [Planctomycetales bacterium]